MARKTTLCRNAQGLYVRNLGWKATANGYTQNKFYLGRDEDQARLASVRLEQLWKEVEARWQRENAGLPPPGSPGLEVTERTAADGTRYIALSAVGLGVMRTTERPVWDETTLAIADSVRQGEPVSQLLVPEKLRASDPSLIAQWLTDLERDITVIKIELADEMARCAVQNSLEADGRQLISLGRRLLQKTAGGETLYAGLDAYRKWVESKYTVNDQLTTWGGSQLRQISFLRQHLPNAPLDELDGDRIEQLVELIRQRPIGKRKKRISVAWASNCIKQLRSFIRWLHKCPNFAWKRPSDFEWMPVKIPMMPEEKAAQLRAPQVKTYTLEELKTCWQYATPFQRLTILLALNCGFGRGELASLDLGELYVRQPHPHQDFIDFKTAVSDSWISRVRPKSSVYSEWRLWPETVAAIEWWLARRRAITVSHGVTTLLVTRTGRRFDAPTKASHSNARLSNAWTSLTSKIRKDMPAFRKLSFNKLRKTAGNLIRAEAGGEIASIFLAHGEPIKKDGLLDVYTNRPFGKVHEAIDAVGRKLRGVWGTIEKPFPAESGDATRLSKAKINRIKTLRKQGFKIDYIAQELGVLPADVQRWTKDGKAVKTGEPEN